MSFDRNQRILRARLAAHCLHASGGTNTAPGTKAFLDRFELEVDPDRTLDPAERCKRAAHARKAYFLSLALKSSRARAAARRRHGHPADELHDRAPDPRAVPGEPEA